MVVTGTITVNPDGSVKAYTVKDVDKLPPAARQIVQATVPHWQFKPILVAGKATVAETGMSLRIVADMAKGGNATVRVAGAQFGCNAYQAKSELPMACVPDESLQTISCEPPSYPVGAAREGVGGEVFLVLEIDRSGHVAKVAATKVNLDAYAQDPSWIRRALAKSAITAARKWTFRIPTTGRDAAKDHWFVYVPVDYYLGSGSRKDEYGKWTSYLPGPVRTVPWAAGDSTSGDHANSDALAGDGAPFVRDGRFVLKTPLTGNGSQS
ncbi:MAG TPA: energy transducer TonB [Rhodanobacteraceae bacterium]|nr:energy transducer TonB [Rhodanobacteraceae bacterium]